jgi:hypothetical protein
MKAFIKFQTVFSGRFQTVQENASLIRVIDGLRFEPNRPKLVLSLYPDRDPAGYLTFRFRSNLSNVTDFNCVQIPSSHSHRPSQSSAGERRRRTRGRERDEVETRERERERERYFFLKGDYWVKKRYYVCLCIRRWSFC